MSIDIKTILCQQCGSTDVAMISETKGVCNACGAQFIVRQSAENLPEGERKHKTIVKGEVIPEYSKEEFIRKVWLRLAKEDAPIEIFAEELGEVKQIEHEVLISGVTAKVRYQASIGYDREEPYIAYEKYDEDEPYLTTESYYDFNTHSKRTRQVTKYKRVQRQRQVTRYKTVTDWSLTSGESYEESVAAVENNEGRFLDEDLFLDSFAGSKQESLRLIESDELQITEQAKEAARRKNAHFLYYSVQESLPGDHQKDFDFNIDDITECTDTLVKALEYEVSLFWNGKPYFKHAFPFGTLKIGGDVIENEVSLDAITEKKQAELKHKILERENSVDTIIAKKTAPISLLTIALLVASIIVSWFVRSTALNVIVFVAAVASFVFNTVFVKLTDERENKQAETDVQAYRIETESEIDDYTKNYKIKQREALDAKLQSLGLAPVSAAEL